MHDVQQIRLDPDPFEPPEPVCVGPEEGELHWASAKIAAKPLLAR